MIMISVIVVRAMLRLKFSTSTFKNLNLREKDNFWFGGVKTAIIDIL